MRGPQPHLWTHCVSQRFRSKQGSRSLSRLRATPKVRLEAEQEVIKANEELDDATRRNDADALARTYADSRSCRVAFGPGVHSVEDSREYEEEHFSSHRVLDHSGDPSERLLETSASPPSG